jgi:hypothetical protein
MAGGVPVQIGSAARVIPGAATSPSGGAAVAQLGATDKAPTAPASPRRADVVAQTSLINAEMTARYEACRQVQVLG